ncbi:MAG: GtrA family protein [Proteobacteria bacterium]|nr:GtrA family protein [Pseudomonadota bacterium]
MIPVERLKTRFPALAEGIAPYGALLRKAVSFALVGLINAAVDAGLFFLALRLLTANAAVTHALAAAAEQTALVSADNLALILANVFAWFFAACGSYAMNSYFTFAAESGRRLTPRAWATFLASGTLGVMANTATLVIAARFMPVVAAKGCAMLVAFTVNFSLSHLVVFRPARR